MENDYIKGQEIGKIMQGLKDLGRNMDNGFVDINKKFDSLKCEPNTEKITVMHEWYTDHKELKKYISKTVIKVILSGLLSVSVLSGIVYAFLPKT